MEEGKRFSLVYLQRGAPVRDSRRFRNRIAAYYHEHFFKHRDEISKIIHEETGARVKRLHSYVVDDFLERADLRDVLDAITIIYQVAAKEKHSLDALEWKMFVERVLREENVGYRLDSKCGVHYFVDEEFERNRVATLSALDAPGLSGVRTAYEDSYRYLDSDPPETKAAVRAMFEALEILVRQMVPTTKNLNRWVVENPLKEKCVKLYETEPTAKTVVAGLFDGFADWVHVLHNYRHGQPSEQPVAPAIEVAIYVLSSGSGFLRWLVGINSDLGNQAS